MNIKEAFQSAKEDIDVATDWCNQLYADNFAKYFSEAKTLFSRLKSDTKPITDEELSWILISLPINLFDVSEVLNTCRLHEEVIKLQYKQKEAKYIKSSTAKTITQKKDEASIELVDDKLLLMAYSVIISRVESEISLSKELIMGAKKIWDSRRKVDNVMPVSEINIPNTPLPDYQKAYIRGGEL